MNPYTRTPSPPSSPPICPPYTTDRALVARIDLHILPCLCLLYLLAFLDRVNIANARPLGLDSTLGLTGVQFNTALVVFFIPYVLFEIPSNALLQRLSPRLWLSACGLGFGVITICQGFVRNYRDLLVTRFLLGLCECGMLPGCFYVLGMWYRRTEAQRRFSLFFSASSLAGAFGGLAAGGIAGMDGLGGYSGWRWIFIIEGAVTCAVAVVFLVTFPSFPEAATWLTDTERSYIQAKLRADQGPSAASHRITLSDVTTILSDPKVWLGGLMYFALIVPAYGYAFFAPTIIKTYGFSPVQTQLHSVPPYAASFAFAMLLAEASDRVARRLPFVLASTALALVGLAMLRAIHKVLAAQYAALFLVVMGLYSAMPIIICWFNMNLAGHHRRAVGTAWQVGFGNIGGVVSTFSFVAADGPKYEKGYTICLAFAALGCVTAGVYAVALARENRRRERGGGETLSEEEKMVAGDLNPEFRYML